MAEYIEVDQMWKCETCFHHRSGKCALGMFGCDHGESYRPAYSKLKKADVATVVHGQWIEHEWAEESEGLLISNYECTVCHEWVRNKSNYCPHCGARMDGE